MTEPFTYTTPPTRIVFGPGSRGQLAAELAALGASRVLLIATSRQLRGAPDLPGLLGPLLAGTFDQPVMHTPVEVTRDALSRLQAVQADALVAVGGGSAIGLSKALSLRTRLPQVVLPTTYAGSEVTPILGQTQAGEKTTLRDPAVLPRTVIYDVDLTLGLPPLLSATSGMNAIAHAVEALYAHDRNPVTSLMAEEALRALARSLPRIHAVPGDREARSDALYGAWLAGSCLASVGMALHHKLAHVLGGSFGLPHAETHAALLPHTVAYNLPSAPGELRRAAAALGGQDAPALLFALNRRLEVPSALRDLGMPEDGIEQAADLAVRSPYWNPRPLERQELLGLLRRAWAGESPRST